MEKCYVCRMEGNMAPFKSVENDTEDRTAGTKMYLNDFKCKPTVIYVHYNCMINHFINNGNTFGVCEICNEKNYIGTRIITYGWKIKEVIKANVVFWLILIMVKITLGLFIDIYTLSMLNAHWIHHIMILKYPRLKGSIKGLLTESGINVISNIPIYLYEVNTNKISYLITVILLYAIYNRLFFCFLSGSLEVLKFLFNCPMPLVHDYDDPVIEETVSDTKDEDIYD